MTGKIDYEANLEARAQFFKALGHPVRLLILNLIRSKPRHGEELAAILHLNPATISHHLGKLADVGLLEHRKDQYYVLYSLVPEHLVRSLDDTVFLPQEGIQATTEHDAYRTKVLHTFMKRGRLTQIPSQLKKRQVVLETLVEEFDPDREYTELEVNRILIEFHEDVATLRRGLIEHHLMTRHQGIYRRVVDDPPAPHGEE